MKKIFSENKVLVIGGGLIILFSILLFWPWKLKKEVAETSKSKGVIQIGGIINKPEMVDWSEAAVIVPETLSVLKPGNNFINGEETVALRKNLNMDSAKIGSSNESFSLFESDEATLALKFKEREIDYQVKKVPTGEGVKLTEAELVSQFRAMVGKLFPEKETGGVGVKYLKDEFRAVGAEANSADYVEITANFVYKNIPIRSFSGMPSVKAQYNFAGKLLRLTVSNPFDKLVEEEKATVKSLMEIKETETSEVMVFDVNGEHDYEIATGQVKIGSIKVDETNLVYIYNPEGNNFLPYLLGSGVIDQETMVVIGVPILK